MMSRQSISSLRVRRMELADNEDVRELCKQLGYPSAAAAFECRLKELLRNPYHEAFVAELNCRRIVGWAHIYEVPSLLSPPTAELGGLVVAEGYRRRGIGCALIEALDQWANVRGMRSLLLATRTDRAGAKAFYQRLHFSTDYDATYLRRDINARRLEAG